jgi:hypothetical protein
MAEAMKPPAGAVAPSPSALEKLRAAMDDSQAAVDRLPPEVKEQARKEAEASLDPEGYGQGAMGLKAFGDPGGMPAPAVPPKQDPYKPMKEAEPEDIALRAAEVGSVVDPTPASDAVAAKIYWDKGDKEAAAWTLGLSLGGLGAGAALTKLLKWRKAWKAERALDDVPMEQATDEANELTTYAVRQMRERYEKLAQGGADIKAGRFKDQGPLDEQDRQMLAYSLKHGSGRNIDEFSDAELRRLRDIGAASGFEDFQKVPGGYGPEDLDPRSGNTPGFDPEDPTIGPYHKIHQSSPGFDKNWFEDEVAKMGRTPEFDLPPTKLPGTPEEIKKAFYEMGRIQRAGPESQMVEVGYRDGIQGPITALVEHVGDLTHRMGDLATGSVRGKVRKTYDHIYVFDETGNTVRGLKTVTNNADFHEALIDEGYRRHVMNSEAPYNPIPLKTREKFARDLEEQMGLYAQEHRTVPVYNEVQRLANDAAIAIGERRYIDAKDALGKLQRYLDEGDDAFRVRMERIEPEFARPGVAKPPAAEAPPVSKRAKEPYPDAELLDLFQDLPVDRDSQVDSMHSFVQKFFKKNQKKFGISDQDISDVAELPEDVLEWLFKIYEPVEEASGEIKKKIGPLF